MDVATLLATHPTVNAELWGRYDALYRGGDVFRQSVEKFLPRNPEEPDPVYLSRKTEAHYCGYVGPLLDWFAAKLLASPLVVRAKDRKRLEAPGPDAPDLAADSWYAQWKEDVDGAGCDLVDFLRARFTQACVKGRAWWLVQAPDDDGMPAVSRAEWEERRLGDAIVVPLENEQVLDWEVDGRGALEWAVVHSYEQRRDTIATLRSRVRETWRIYDRQNVETWAVEYDPGKGEPQPLVAVLVGRAPHKFNRVPLVRLGFTGCRGVRVKIGARMIRLSSSALEGFWLMQRLADAQIAHFRTSAALDWNIKRTCYAMPVFKLGDNKPPPKMGVGYFIQIGEKESAEWIAPPTEHLAIVASRAETLKDEIYRVGNQMAQGVENNAAATGRSAESKQADASSTEVILRVYGAIVRAATEETYDLLSQARGDHEKLSFSVEGLETFSLVDAGTVIETALDAAEIRIPSKILQREIAYRVADALLPGSEQATRDAIRKQIADHFDAGEGGAPKPPGFGACSNEDDDEQNMDALHMAIRDDERRIELPQAMLVKLRDRCVGKLGAFQVWAVDGNAVRLLDNDFNTGGNPSRYAYIPDGELWVEQGIVDAPADLAATLLHQAIEAVVMEDGSIGYPAAHAAARAMEELLRKAFATGATSADSPAAALAVAAAWLPSLTKAARGLAAAHAAKSADVDDDAQPGATDAAPDSTRQPGAPPAPGASPRRGPANAPRRPPPPRT